MFDQIYSQKVLEHVKNPQNFGEIKDADGVATVGNPVCVPPGTLIYTRKGVSPIENLKVGDLVLTHEGTYYPIIKIHKRNYQGRLVYLRIHNLGEILLTPDHHLLALKTSSYSHKFSKRKKAILDWFLSEEIEKGDIVLWPRVKPIKDYPRQIVFDEPKPKWDHKSKELPEKVKIGKEFLRLLGFYLSEGYSRIFPSQGTVGFVFGGNEENFKEETIELMGNLFGLKPARVERKNNSIGIVFYSARLARFLTRIAGKGAAEKHLPDWFFGLPVGRQSHLLATLWLGDGYINRETAKFVTISKQLAYQVKNLLINQKIIFSFLRAAEKGIHKENYCLYVKNDDSLAKLAKIMNKTINFPIRKISPKRSWFDKNFYYVAVRETKEVEYSGSVYNLEVEQVASYITEAVTLHNCGDIMRLYIKVGKRESQSVQKGTEDTEEYIKDVKFQTLGCGAALASSSILTTMVKGKSLDEALKISNKAVAEALGGLPPVKLHCSVLAEEALQKAIENYKKKLT